MHQFRCYYTARSLWNLQGPFSHSGSCHPQLVTQINFSVAWYCINADMIDIYIYIAFIQTRLSLSSPSVMEWNHVLRLYSPPSLSCRHDISVSQSEAINHSSLSSRLALYKDQSSLIMRSNYPCDHRDLISLIKT